MVTPFFVNYLNGARVLTQQVLSRHNSLEGTEIILFQLFISVSLLRWPVRDIAIFFFFLSYRAINARKYYRAIISQFIAVVMNKTDKIREGQIQIDDKHNYRPLSEPMVKETHSKVLRLITDLHRENHIDDMTRKWLSQTPNPQF